MLLYEDVGRAVDVEVGNHVGIRAWFEAKGMPCREFRNMLNVLSFSAGWRCYPGNLGSMNQKKIAPPDGGGTIETLLIERILFQCPYSHDFKTKSSSLVYSLTIILNYICILRRTSSHGSSAGYSSRPTPENFQS